MRYLRLVLLALVALALLLGVPRSHGAHISPTVIATVLVGDEATGVGVNPTTDRVYVANGDGTVSVIDGATNAVIATIPVVTPPVFNSFPCSVGVNATTNRVYAANFTDDTVSVIDGATNAVIATIPVVIPFPCSVGVNPSTNRVYVTNSGDTVSVIDGTLAESDPANAVIATVPVGGQSIGVNPTTNRIYVGNNIDETVSVIDGASNAVVATVALGRVGPIAVEVNPTTNRVYVSGGSVIDGTLAESDPANAVIASLPATGHSIGVNPTTDRIYVGNLNSSTVSVIDGASNAVVATIDLGLTPEAVGVNASTDRVYAAAGSTVFVIADDQDGDGAVQLPGTGGGPDGAQGRSSGEWLPAWAASLAVGVLTLAAGGWYVRRRWLR